MDDVRCVFRELGGPASLSFVLSRFEIPDSKHDGNTQQSGTAL
jgi:hypothetical protein